MLGPKTSLYLTLWYLGNATTYREISELFGVAKSTVHECVQRVIEVLCNISYKFIEWPRGEAALQTVQEFQEVAGFPGVIGAIDGSHISVKAPNIYQADYLDRTMKHSINLMAVCLPDKRFSFISAGAPGSYHDSRAFKNSGLYERIINNPRSLFPSSDYHIIGDSAFPLTTYMLVLFRDTGRLSATQIHFNTKLSKTRVIIENAFAFLKGRFRRLKHIEVKVKSSMFQFWYLSLRDTRPNVSQANPTPHCVA